MTVAPGWYPDPTAPSTQRYHDGTRWTEHVAPLSTGPGGEPGWAQPTLPTSPWAVASLILALVWIAGIGSIAAIAAGIKARKDVRAGTHGGNGLATAGIVIGIIGLIGAGMVLGGVLWFRNSVVDLEAGLPLFVVQVAQGEYLAQERTYATTLDELTTVRTSYSDDVLLPGVEVRIVRASDFSFCAEAIDSGETFHIRQTGGVVRGPCPAG